MDVNKQKRIISQNMIRNIAEYDSGILEAENRENKRKNIAVNCKDKNILPEVQKSFSRLSGNYDKNQVMIFHALNAYYIKQETGLNLGKPLSEEQKKELERAFMNLAETDSPKLAHTLSDCFLYSERMTHYAFSPEKIYSQGDYEKKISVSSPKAAEFAPKEIRSVADDRTAKQQRDRERDIKPREPTHRIGGF